MKKLFIASLVLWILTVGFLAFKFIKGSTTPSSDNRLAVNLTPSEKDMVLGEMRSMLTAVNGVLRAAATKDWQQAKTAALGAGKAMAVDATPGLMGKLPMEFKTLGMSVHDDFDSLAEDLVKGMTESQVFERLGAITNKCIACHASYRFGTRELSIKPFENIAAAH